METDPTLNYNPAEAEKPLAPANPAQQAAMPDEAVEFRPFQVFTRRVMITLAAYTLGMVAGMLSSEHRTPLDDPANIALVGGLLGFAAVMILAPRLNTKRKGGIPPLRFLANEIEVPVTASQRKTRRIPYEDILSVSVFGKKKRAAVVLDTKRRAFVYPLREFADENAADKIRAILARRIGARPNGATQWGQIEKRQSMAAVFAQFKPRATQAMIAAIAAVFIAQICLENDSLFGYLDMGANAPFLVLKGQWYRLVTANLLHAGALHFYCNAVFGYIVAALVERQLGTKRFAILLMLTGILSQVASAAWSQYSQNGHLFSVGISGALFGMLGAQAVLNRLFGGQLPGGYRFTPRTWWSMMILNFLVIPLLVPEVDVACHVGGFLSGIVVGWMLTRGQTDIAQPPPFGSSSGLALALLSAIWIGAVAQGVSDYFDPAAQKESHAALVKAVVDDPSPVEALDNALAWTLATQKDPDAATLDAALTLANRAVKAATQHKHEDTDTLATVYYRRGALDTAIDLEEPLFIYAPIYGSQLARFLNAYVKKDGIRLVGGKTAPPKIMLSPPAPSGDRAFEVTLAEPSDKGAELYALLMHGDRLAGILDVGVPPKQTTGKGTILHDAFEMAEKDDLAYTLVPAQLDTSACRCESDTDASVSYVPMEPDIEELP